MSGEIVRWGDAAQYEAAPIKKDELGRITPQVHLLWATPDPLGAIAAVCRQYKGIPTYDLSDITDEERREYWQESFKSHLRAPHEFVQFHFQVEAVTRSFTHQAVRQRTATFGQESLRFAVKDNLAQEVALPPSIVDGSNAASVWESCIKDIETAYNALVNSGIPAEDARGLLPHATTTRLHWRTNLNDLLHHAGNRLCTQAQFEWRFVMIGVMNAIKNFSPLIPAPRERDVCGELYEPAGWQFELIGTPWAKTFAPICYHTGKCEFRAIFDRPCSIRDRVDAFAANSIPSSQWGEGAEHVGGADEGVEIPPIHVEEWLLDHTAARGDH
jgi:flavin-dependent thymidylate synthase